MHRMKRAGLRRWFLIAGTFIADHLRLKAGRAQALRILKQSPWDGGIITEGVKADTGIPDRQGLAFATASVT